jgi:hypothetical protein
MFSQTHLVTLTADLKQLAIWHWPERCL